jgi:hypothetical protein
MSMAAVTAAIPRMASRMAEWRARIWSLLMSERMVMPTASICCSIC